MITIRGVVSPGELVEPGNSVYVDDIYVSGMRTVLPGFYDIQSVQVLKGPQAGLYGRNTTGGAVIITTGQPTDELCARLNTSYAQYDTKEWTAPSMCRSRMPCGCDRRSGTAIATAATTRVDLSTRTSTPERERGGRLTIAVMPSDRTRFTLTAEFDEKEESGFYQFRWYGGGRPARSRPAGSRSPDAMCCAMIWAVSNAGHCRYQR